MADTAATGKPLVVITGRRPLTGGLSPGAEEALFSMRAGAAPGDDMTCPFMPSCRDHAVTHQELYSAESLMRLPTVSYKVWYAAMCRRQAACVCAGKAGFRREGECSWSALLHCAAIHLYVAGPLFVMLAMQACQCCRVGCCGPLSTCPTRRCACCGFIKPLAVLNGISFIL